AHRDGVGLGRCHFPGGLHAAPAHQDGMRSLRAMLSAAGHSPKPSRYAARSLEGGRQMSVVKINAIHVPEGAGPELEARFAARKHAVDSAPGFEGFQLLRPVAGEDRYFVVTTW